ncbi:RDD family protein [Streptomyces sp. NPDC002587]
MTASPGDGEHAAREGYYPDPSIPGYVRYWNGAAWVPGTSRPAPAPAPTPAPAPVPAPAPAAPVEETGPVFLDQTSMTEALAEPEPEREPEAGPEPVLRAAVAEPVAGRGAGRAPERAAEQAVWQADPLHQAGFGGPRDHRVSWGSPAESPAAPGPGISLARTPSAAAAATPAQRFPAQAAAGILSARSPAAAAPAPSAAPTPAPAPPPAPAPAPAPEASPAPEPVPAPAWPDAPGGSGSGGSGLTSSWPEAVAAPAAPPSEAVRPLRPRTTEAAPAAPAEPFLREATARRSPAPSPAPSPARDGSAGAQPAEAPRFDPWQPRTGGARPKLPPRGTTVPAGPRPEPVPVPEPVPGSRSEFRPESRSEGTRTPRAVFERMAEQAVRPAGLVRRAVARALDSLVLAAVGAAAARPLLPAATAHVQGKVDAARTTGRTTTVWLLDGTIAGHLGLVLGAVVLFGVFYEALPTARWGRTPGKKLLGVRVLDVATLRPPTFGAALRRWLVYVLLGVPGSLWCLVDRPRRQGWHDKAARTYVAR